MDSKVKLLGANRLCTKAGFNSCCITHAEYERCKKALAGMLPTWNVGKKFDQWSPWKVEIYGRTLGPDEPAFLFQNSQTMLLLFAGADSHVDARGTPLEDAFERYSGDLHGFCVRPVIRELDRAVAQAAAKPPISLDF